MNWKYFKPKFEFDEDLPSSWCGHTFFAYDLIRNIKPKKVVELGTHYGVSFFSMCQAVKDASLDTELHAVDTWEGDLHAKIGYNEKNKVFNTFKSEFEKNYSTLNIKLHRRFFDDAVNEFANGSIDVLHIDGFHTYEAVRHDFETWLPKMKKDGIILFHDIHEKKDDFGVYKLWSEIKEDYSTFEFYHWHGLGVVFLNNKTRDYLIEKDDDIKGYYNNLFEKYFFEKQDEKFKVKLNSIESDIILQKEVIIQQLEKEIVKMKSSKFWKMRGFYLTYKKKFAFLLFSPGKFIKKYIKVAHKIIFPKSYEMSGIGKKYLEYNKEFLKKLSEKDHPKVLAIVNHYYSDKNISEFPGKSATQDEIIRKSIVEKVIKELKTIPNVDVKICGIKGHSLFEIDKDYSHIENPAFLVYSSIEWMFSQIDDYDYFINIEDDILLTRDTFREIIEFDKENLINKCYHPNRMEYEGGVEYCTDFKARSGWENISMMYKGKEVKVAKNPHSGLAILSKPKMLYACDKVDLKRRDIIIGYYMASAFANVNSPFFLYRSFPDLSRHKVVHLDNWEER